MKIKSIFLSKMLARRIFNLTFLSVVFLCVSSTMPRVKSSLDTTCAPTPGCLGGQVFSDPNCNGIDDVGEVGIEGIDVFIFDNTNTMVNSAITDSNGDWSICGLTDGENYRVEFGNTPFNIGDPLSLSHAGIDNASDVQFLTVPDCTKFSLLDPFEICEADPSILATCFVRGAYNGLSSNLDVILDFKSSVAGDTDGNINGTTAEGTIPYLDIPIYTPTKPTPTVVATFGEVGSIYGLAKADQRQEIYSAAYIKGGTSLGPGESTGNIFLTKNLNATPSSSVYVDLNAVFGAGTAGANPHPVGTTNYFYPNDTLLNPLIGKTGLGDIELSRDEDTLYVVNMEDRMLYSIPTSGPLNTSTISRIAIPTANLPTVTDAIGTPGTCPPQDVRPFGMGRDASGAIYVGAVCSCESISAGMDAEPNPASYQMTAYVWRFDGTNFTLVLDDGLRFNRDVFPHAYTTFDDHINIGDLNLDWEPWSDLTVAYSEQMDQNEPMLADIEFAEDGSMILGFRDRSGDIQSFFNGFTSNGDIYKACPTGMGTWEMETNGSCGGISTAGVNNFQGPGDGEYFFEDIQGDFLPNSGNGGLLVVKGTNEVVSAATDPVFLDSNGNLIFAPRTGGVQVYDISTGECTGAYNIYEMDQFSLFGKAAGIGDLESSCDAVPLEIGNYVWCDSISNGIQDAIEAGVDGMIVQLYDSTGVLIAQDTTVNGNYYFNEFNVDTTGISVDAAGQASPNTAWSGLRLFTKYYILFGNGQYDSTTGAFTIAGEAYNGIAPFDVNGNVNDNIDSDADPSTLSVGMGAMPANFPVICVSVDDIGCGDHKYDLGITCPLYDFGDLPDTSAGTGTSNYETNFADMGPRHTIISGLRIGNTLDSEFDAQPMANALGDGADEDGFNFTSLDIFPGGTFRLPINITNTTGLPAELEIWIDWNGDGDFNDSGEMIADLTDDTLGNFTPSNISVTVPSNAATGTPLGFRARLSHQDNMTPTGSVNSGEVEDYLITVACKTDICLPVSIIRN